MTTLPKSCPPASRVAVRRCREAGWDPDGRARRACVAPRSRALLPEAVLPCLGHQTDGETLEKCCGRMTTGPRSSRTERTSRWRYDAAGGLDNRLPWFLLCAAVGQPGVNALRPPTNRQGACARIDSVARGGSEIAGRRLLGWRPRREEVVQGPGSGASSPFLSG